MCIRDSLGEEPKGQYDETQLESEWGRFMNGEDFEPPEGETQLALQHMIGHTKQKREKYDKLDEAYRPNFDSHLFKTMVNYMKFMQNAQRDVTVNQMAMGDIARRDQMGMGGPPQRQPVAPGAPGGPGSPAAPVAPGGPAGPIAPGGPGAPPAPPGGIA